MGERYAKPGECSDAGGLQASTKGKGFSKVVFTRVDEALVASLQRF